MVPQGPAGAPGPGPGRPTRPSLNGHTSPELLQAVFRCRARAGTRPSQGPGRVVTASWEGPRAWGETVSAICGDRKLLVQGLRMGWAWTTVSQSWT